MASFFKSGLVSAGIALTFSAPSAASAMEITTNVIQAPVDFEVETSAGDWAWSSRIAADNQAAMAGYDATQSFDSVQWNDYSAGIANVEDPMIRRLLLQGEEEGVFVQWNFDTQSLSSANYDVASWVSNKAKMKAVGSEMSDTANVWWDSHAVYTGMLLGEEEGVFVDLEMEMDPGTIVTVDYGATNYGLPPNSDKIKAKLAKIGSVGSFTTEVERLLTTGEEEGVFVRYDLMDERSGALLAALSQ
ncbi:hypothetical protein [uncultured Roseobacter sp.]|uniref:hypothetical protein n=1 Tax=uncultured Roseobacter sp. TaxID=114847 RepID=UPI0026034A5A|nr:hypothetical protein [uncultured Roseobacter sp.]